MRAVPGVTAAAGVRELPAAAHLSVDGGGGDVVLVAADRELLALHPTWRLAGRWPRAGEALVGEALAAPAPGEVHIAVPAGGELTVVGTLNAGGALDGAVVVPLAALPALGFDAAVDRIEVRADHGRLGAVAAAVEAAVPGAEARPLLRVSESEAALGRRLTWLLAALGVLTCLLAAISVGAATAALVEERRTEVGLFLALGFTGGRTAAIFAAELLTAALAAAVVGGLAGETAAVVLATRLLAAAGGPAAPWGALAAATVAAVAVVGTSMIFALRRVVRLEPARVLRGE